MKDPNKRMLLCTCITCALILLFCGILKNLMGGIDEDRMIKVGFIYNMDESVPYTYNFVRAQHAIEAKYGDRVQTIVKSNVPEDDCEHSMRMLADEGCELIFITSYGYQETAKKLAQEYPEIQFCQATGDNANAEPVLDNYHNFMGHIYEGRYVTGRVAGMKLKEMIEKGELSPEDAKIGYVAAFPYSEVISGYTAFFMGIRKEVPTAVMTVKYTGTWGDYTKEYRIAKELIEDGCVLISQHSDTIGPAVACEEAAERTRVYHVGYSQSMIDVAPTTSLISSRINWEPYMLEAVDAVLNKRKIEKNMHASINGNDAGAGFEHDWVVLLGLNDLIAADNTAEMINETVVDLEKGKIAVFQGDYIGYDPYDPSDTWDLNNAYPENEKASSPSFHYILDGVIKVEE